MTDIAFNSEEKTPVGMFNYAYKWALIGSIAYVVKLYGLYFYNDFHYYPQAGGLTGMLFDILLVLATMYLCTSEYRKKELDDYITFGKAFKVSYLTGILVSIILAVFMYVFHTYQVDFDQVMSEQTDMAVKMLKERGLTPEQIKKQMSMAPSFTKTIEFSSGVLIIVGFTIYAIYALIVAAILKRNPPAI